MQIWAILSIVLAAFFIFLLLGNTEGNVLFRTALAASMVGLVAAAILRKPQPERDDVRRSRPETRFAARVSEQIRTAYCLINAQGIVVYFNPAMLRLFPHIKRGEHYSIIARSTQFIEPIRDHLLVQPQTGEFRFETHRDGDRYFQGYLSLLPENLQSQTGAVVLLEIHDQSALRQNDRIRQDFIANASHELRTPLAAILGGIETLRSQSDLGKDEQSAVLKLMDRQAKRMGRLVEDLMSLAKLENHSDFRPETIVNLTTIVAASVDATTPIAEQSKVALDNTLTDVYQVRGDADQLQQVFINLIENAIYYGKKGQTVTLSSVEGKGRYQDYYGIKVSDQGHGIAPEDIPRLTERFYRVDATASRNKGGTGLGLAIVKHILRRHGAILDIESQLGVGSDFTVWLPK